MLTSRPSSFLHRNVNGCNNVRMCSCHNYQNLPPQCRLIPDPNNSCCKTYVCDVQVTTTQSSIAQGGVPTPVAGVGESSFHIFNTDYNDIIIFIRLLLVSAGVTHNYAAMRSDLCAAINQCVCRLLCVQRSLLQTGRGMVRWLLTQMSL